MTDASYEQLAVWSQVLGSIAFLVVLVYLFRRFVAPAVAASKERKNAELAEAERRRDAARDLVAVAQHELAVADDDVQAIRERAARDAARERERIVEDAKGEGERLLRNADGELDRGRAAAQEILRDELLAKALEIAREAAAKVDPATNERLVAGVVATLEREKGEA
jgi:F-type H+-transporting ATPase subunit b